MDKAALPRLNQRTALQSLSGDAAVTLRPALHHRRQQGKPAAKLPQPELKPLDARGPGRNGAENTQEPLGISQESTQDHSNSSSSMPTQPACHITSLWPHPEAPLRGLLPQRSGQVATLHSPRAPLFLLVS